MLLQPYHSTELAFAWCYRVYYRWRSHRRKPISVLPELTTETLGGLVQPLGIHLLELASDPIDIRALVSLAPAESVSVAASKVKGRVSKWISEQFTGQQHVKSLARGYFAMTTGPSAAEDINAYLQRQAEHHGYADRDFPPVFVGTRTATSETESVLRADHAVTRLRFHIVLATWRRHGVFSQASAAAICERWQQLQADLRARIDKVSFVPDHVHAALTLHPAVAPASVVVALMNAGQEIMWRQFERDVIQANVPRLWQPSAYLGSFGDLASPAISSYVSEWERDDGE
jgi:REP element-mobilizing transposase RayT